MFSIRKSKILMIDFNWQLRSGWPEWFLIRCSCSCSGRNSRSPGSKSQWPYTPVRRECRELKTIFKDSKFLYVGQSRPTFTLVQLLAVAFDKKPSRFLAATKIKVKTQSHNCWKRKEHSPHLFNSKLCASNLWAYFE